MPNDFKFRKRYSFDRASSTFKEDKNGPYLAIRGPFGSVGLMDLAVDTALGYPVDPKTGEPYRDHPDFNWKGRVTVKSR